MFKLIPLTMMALILSGCLNSVSGEHMQNEFYQAAKQNNIVLLKQLIQQSVDLEERDPSGATALMLATRANHIQAAKLLIENGADVNAKDRIDDSPYLYAGARGHLDILKMTLLHGADITSVNRYGGTALIPAAERGHVEAVEILILAGVRVDHVNNLGWTALLEAVILGDGTQDYLKIVNLLLQAGADPNLSDKQGVTALAHAEARGYSEIAKALRQAGGHR